MDGKYRKCLSSYHDLISCKASEYDRNLMLNNFTQNTGETFMEI